MYTSIQQGCIELIKSDSEVFYNTLEKISISNKCRSFCTFYLSKNPEKKYPHFYKNMKQHNCFQYY